MDEGHEIQHTVSYRNRVLRLGSQNVYLYNSVSVVGFRWIISYFVAYIWCILHRF